MGMYVNFGNEAFRSTLNGTFVDKSRLIEVVNETLNSEHQFTCVSRARRFGKSIAAKMLCAYYDVSCGSRELFSKLQIASSSSFSKHLNRYPVLFIDMTNFVTRYSKQDIVENIQRDVIADLKKAYPNDISDENDLMTVLHAIVQNNTYQEKFIMIIDEWDAICREYAQDEIVVNQYINLLRQLFKSANAMNVFAGVYMTGILPIKKYNTQSALNNFEEYTMINPGPMAPFFAFNQEEVQSLCAGKKVDEMELKQWYDGYRIGVEECMYNPLSITKAVRNEYCESYWSSTGTYETVSSYIKMDFDGLKDDILKLLAGKSCGVNTASFQNDLSVVNSRDDVLTILIHLGYLSYNRDTKECVIPNREIAKEFENAIADTGWNFIATALKQSENLLKETLAGNTDAVAKAIDLVHQDNTSILQYNNENSLACVLTLAYYSAQKDYKMIREMTAGKGFADIILLPYKTSNKQAILLELKYNKDSNTAIDQIKDKRYPDVLKDLVDSVILVGVNYDKKRRVHDCVIEKVMLK